MNRRQARQQIAELARELSEPRRPNPVLALYRWRYEIALAALVPYTVIELDRLIGPIFLAVLLAGLASMAWHWPTARRFVATRIRVVVTQHRLRTGFARARVCTLDGRLPAILWTTPRGDVILVWLMCPAGVDADLIHQRRQVLAAACFATDVTVTTHPRHRNLVLLAIRTAEPEGRNQTGGRADIARFD